MTWGFEDIGDQRGRIVVVTGANSGIGFQTALELARRGADVVLACRQRSRAITALGRIRQEVPLASVQIASLDLADLRSVRAFAEDVTANTPRVDLLVNNAGVMTPPYGKTADGFELQLGTNHLGHFALTGLLWPHLMEAEAPRVVTVSSTMHRLGRINFDDLQSVKSYSRAAAYGQSKLANLLFTAELGRRAEAVGAPLISVGAHPGVAGTNLIASGTFANVPAPVRKGIGWVVNSVLPPSTRGAMPVLYAATVADARNGDYFGPPAVSLGYWGAPLRQQPAAAARDEYVAGRLWELSEELTGVTYPEATSTN